MGAHTLTESEIAIHYHEGNEGRNFITGGTNGARDTSSGNDNLRTDQYTASAGESKSHSHTFTVSTAQINSLPPFYVLVFIMRCA